MNEETKIDFAIQGNEIIRLEVNGDIYVSVKLKENDKQVVEKIREWLRLATGGAKNVSV